MLSSLNDNAQYPQKRVLLFMVNGSMGYSRLLRGLPLIARDQTRTEI